MKAERKEKLTRKTLLYPADNLESLEIGGSGRVGGRRVDVVDGGEGEETRAILLFTVVIL